MSWRLGCKYIPPNYILEKIYNECSKDFYSSFLKQNLLQFSPDILHFMVIHFNSGNLLIWFWWITRDLHLHWSIHLGQNVKGTEIKTHNEANLLKGMWRG